MVGNKTSNYILTGIAITIVILLLILSGIMNNALSSITSINLPGPSSVTNSYSTSYSVKKSNETLYYIKTIGSIKDAIHSYIFRSIVTKIINEYGKGLINNSFNPRYYVILYSNYKDYKNIMTQHNDLESIKTQLDKISCRILASGMYIAIQHYSRGKINITLVFRKGIAICGEKYRPIPRIDSHWIIKDGFHIAVFNYLNITRTVHVNMQTGFAFDNHRKYIGEWIFNLEKIDLASNSTLLLYNVLPRTIMKVDNKTYSLANLIYVEKYDDMYIAKPIVILRNKTIIHRGGLILMEKMISPYQNTSSCPICGENIRIKNLPPFLVYRRSIPENRTLIMYCVNNYKLSRVNHHRELMKIIIIGKHEHIFKTINGEINIDHIIYGVKIQNNVYVMGLDLGLINATYSSDGKLLELKMSVTTGLLYNALPMIIDNAFCIGYNSLVDASAIEIIIVNK